MSPVSVYIPCMRFISVSVPYQLCVCVCVLLSTDNREIAVHWTLLSSELRLLRFVRQLTHPRQFFANSYLRQHTHTHTHTRTLQTPPSFRKPAASLLPRSVATPPSILKVRRPIATTTEIEVDEPGPTQPAEGGGASQPPRKIR